MKNVILITADSLRADRVSCYGHTRETTPNIDGLAKDGKTFTNAFTQGASTPFSFPAILGGIYPTAIDELTDYFPYFPIYSDHLPLLAEVFKDAGYSTGGFHSNPYLSRFYGYSRGFDRFFDSLPEKGEESASWYGRKWRKKAEMWLRKRPGIYRMTMGVRDLFKPMTPPYVMADGINRRAIKFMKEIDGPFFLWVHYMDTHNPFLPDLKSYEEIIGKPISTRQITKRNRPISHRWTDRFDKESAFDLYDASIYCLDKEIGRLLEHLRSAGLYDDSIIAFTSDHGDSFMEHGIIAHPPENFYDEQIRVPLLIKGSGTGTDDNLMGLVDVPPTLADLAGLDPPKDMMGSAIPHDRKEVYVGVVRRDYKRMAIRTKRWKYMYNPDSGEERLFDLETDPEETADVASERKEGASALRELAELHLKSTADRSMAMKLRKKGLVKSDPETSDK